MYQPPKEKEAIKKQEIIGETANDKSVSETEIPKENRDNKDEVEDEQITNIDNKITNNDEQHDREEIV